MLNNSINNIMFELRGPVVSAHCVHTCMDMHNRNSVRLPCSAFVGRSTNSNAVPGTVQWESPSDATTRSTYLVSLPTKQIGGKTGHNTPNKLKIGGKPGHNFISTGQQDANERQEERAWRRLTPTINFRTLWFWRPNDLSLVEPEFVQDSRYL